MSGSMMEWAEGGVQGSGGKDWGAKCSPRKPASRLTPIGTPVHRVPTREGGIGTSIERKARDRDQAPRTDRKPGPTPPVPPGNHPNPQTPIPSPDTQSPARRSHQLTTKTSQPEACAASTKTVAPPQKKEQTSWTSATRIRHTKEDT
ncbi:hypothetical protein AMECASPLE_034674 [Ameca splendens]|uniref:Uncharacterized protein n=1 Tax=Ameca splendens TaxID=208324 RepID=A0ABV0YI73_9TELE